MALNMSKEAMIINLLNPIVKQFALQIPLGSTFLTDLSTFKLLHFGMLYHTIFILILLDLIPCASAENFPEGTKFSQKEKFRMRSTAASGRNHTTTDVSLYENL